MPTTLSERLFWSGHSNPASVWSATAVYPLLILGLYRRDRRLLASAAGVVALSATLAPEPADDSAWATRVVLGERVWLARGLLSSPGDLLFALLGVPIHLFTFRSARKRRPVRTLLGTVLSLVVMFVFFARMVRLYETQANEQASQTIEQVVSTT